MSRTQLRARRLTSANEPAQSPPRTPLSTCLRGTVRGVPARQERRTPPGAGVATRIAPTVARPDELVPSPRRPPRGFGVVGVLTSPNDAGGSGSIGACPPAGDITRRYRITM